MGFAGFHPLVSRWFSETLGTPTSAQLRGWAAIREGRHTLIAAPFTRTGRRWTREEAIVELLRGRLGCVGPTTAEALAGTLGIPEADADAALFSLESEGVVLRGTFTSRNTDSRRPGPDSRRPGPSGPGVLEWCDRRLLARIHRYTLTRLRAEIAPVSAADFMRFLFAWQHVSQPAVLTGADGLRAILAQLDGVELPARAWERDVLPARLDRYDPAMLDMLCLTGEVAWARLSTGPTPASAPRRLRCSCASTRKSGCRCDRIRRSG